MDLFIFDLMKVVETVSGVEDKGNEVFILGMIFGGVSLVLI